MYVVVIPMIIPLYYVMHTITVYIMYIVYVYALRRK